MPTGWEYTPTHQLVPQPPGPHSYTVSPTTLVLLSPPQILIADPARHLSPAQLVSHFWCLGALTKAPIEHSGLLGTRSTLVGLLRSPSSPFQAKNGDPDCKHFLDLGVPLNLNWLPWELPDRARTFPGPWSVPLLAPQTLASVWSDSQKPECRVLFTPGPSLRAVPSLGCWACGRTLIDSWFLRVPMDTQCRQYLAQP